jgi:alkylation response protein AidB-like acyl-CoA dehydrogenase
VDLDLTDAQRALREQAREVSLRELVPQAAETDVEQRFPRQAVASLARVGLLAIGLPKEWGGAGQGAVAAAVATEELASGCASTAAVASVQSVVCEAIARFGSDAQKRAWLPGLASGTVMGCFALTESGGSGPAAVLTVAERAGDGFVLRGSKSFVTCGPVADLALVFARTQADAVDSLSAFLVPLKSAGVSIGRAHSKLGLRGAVSSALSFAEVRLDAAALLGAAGAGREILRFTIDGGRIQAAALALGIARAAFTAATRYALERTSNGQPISGHQAIQFKLAEMSATLDAARLLTWRAAAARDRGTPATTFASMAKLESSETATRVASEAISILGGNGCLTDFPVERHFRDAKVTEIYEGTSEMQRLGIASALLKE